MGTLEARGIVVRRGQFVLGPMDITVAEGEGIVFAGRNGSGKTTLLEGLSGALVPEQGGLWYLDSLVYDGKWHRKEYRDAMHNIGVQLQGVEFFDLLTVGEHATFFAELYDEEPTRYLELISECPALHAHEDYKYNALSAGKKQLLHIILAIGHTPKILFLDEPTSGIDDDNKEWLWALLTEFKRDGGAIVFSSHEGREMDAIGDKMLVLSNGQPKVLAAKEDVSGILGYSTRLKITPPSSTLNDDVKQKIMAIEGIVSAEEIGGAWMAASTLLVHDALVSASQLGNDWTVEETRNAGFQDLYEMVRRTDQ